MESPELLKEARFYATLPDGMVQCNLCPHHCRIKDGSRGICRSRECRGGKLYALSYGRACSLAVDPVEKKPLNNFMPGTWCLSLSCTGCNLRCRWCQNSSISQVATEDVDSEILTPSQIVAIALRRHYPSIAFTYTEPFTWWEYMYEIAVLSRRVGLRNILVSAGYVEKEPLQEIVPYIDAANIDIKAMDDSIYREYCGGTLSPVLENILLMKEAGVHVEITNLLVTDLTDSGQQVEGLCKWMAGHGLQDVPLHFSRFFPRYKYEDAPATPKATLIRAKQIALASGIKTVYLGNI